MREEAIISSLQKKWKVLNLLSLAFLSLAFAVIFITCLHQLYQYSFVWILPAWLISFFLMMVALHSWRIQQKDVIVYLNRHIPELEESSGLLLKPVASLNLLEQMQVNKLKDNIEYTATAHPVNRKLKTAAIVLLLSVITSMLIYLLLKPSLFQPPENNVNKIIAPAPQQALPAIASFTVKIKPPAYTNIQLKTQHDLNIIAAEGSVISWQLQTDKPVQHISLKFSDTTTLQLHPVNGEHTIWAGEKIIRQQGFYQVELDSSLSDLYKLEMIKDQPPVITVQSPQASTVIDFGEPQRVTVALTALDDYGINDVSIMATVASGSGEAVKFSGHAIKFENSFSAHNKNYTLKKTIELPSLGMKPGDELYLYITATDNNNQQTQTDTYIISIADTAELMSFDGVINGVNLKPEYFRSQRQIIIETEQLLKDKPILTQDVFNNKSNDLGIDQKLLRLRYGKFLGEEFEANIGEHDEGHDEHKESTGNNANFGNAEAIIDQFAHKHDIAEDATFFDAETKKQLKAVLTEMWHAELQLRTFKPAEALPFEYKALRLLKDLQQQNRVYVAKTNIKTPPLKSETRLTGELDKILSPSSQHNAQQKDLHITDAQKALSILEHLKTSNAVNNDELASLLSASLLMQQQAAAAPGKYLAALQSYQSVLNQVQQQQNISLKDINAAQHGLQLMLAQPSPKPSPDAMLNGNSLSQQYFLNLNKNRP
ncbi:hypothetical protein [Parafilimonas terrae]|uniref:DUF4175 domain-containing protein n=1 Tax=Parafilimonas terrae TaxID=1465490 RepID=A0A1I5R5E1_9BACT|nr:hypothetical protein [Parafilimonas terrae]SFP53784.1 hypothetical protein SAMN05444277_10186 [Parafilimonas terrae]